jgi:hypothetical protein
MTVLEGKKRNSTNFLKNATASPSQNKSFSIIRIHLKWI